MTTPVTLEDLMRTLETMQARLAASHERTAMVLAMLRGIEHDLLALADQTDDVLAGVALLDHRV